MFGRSRAAIFCWPSNLAIITDGVAYVNQELETQGTEVVGDILWRALKGRGGRRGYSQKQTHIREGLRTGVYSNTHPWITQDGRQYASSWGVRVNESVLQGATVWEVTSSEEEEIVIEEVVPKAKAAAKAVVPKAGRVVITSESNFPRRVAARTSEPASASSSSGLESSVHLPKASVRRPPSPPEPRLRPRVYLPDTVSWYDRTVSPHSNSVFQEVESYSRYRGYQNYEASPSFILFLDWHNVLDRAYTEGSWNNRFPADSIAFLRKVKASAREIWGREDALAIVIVSHIEHSEENLTNLLSTCNRLSELRDENLITTIFVTQARTGPTGKCAVIRSFTLGLSVPSCLIDDNHLIIKENSEAGVHTAHVQLRRKPAAPEAELVRHFLLDCADPLHRLFEKYRNR